MLVLFTDASLIDLKVLGNAPSKIPTRLLLIGLPLTMLFGTGLGVLMFDSISIWAIVLMALILSPTDAALGQAVVKSEVVPNRIRQSISVESGLNDGIALPPILFCLAILGAQSDDHGGEWVGFLISQITLGPDCWPGRRLRRRKTNRTNVGARLDGRDFSAAFSSAAGYPRVFLCRISRRQTDSFLHFQRVLD